MAVQPQTRGADPRHTGDAGDLTDEQLRRRAHELIPGGAHTYSKDDEHFAPNAPAFIVRGQGAYVWGSDERRYLDWGMGLRSVILGHAYPAVIEAAAAALRDGANHTRATLRELELAERLVHWIPCAEMVKFGKNGSDATTAAVRLARAYTGRLLVLACNGSFHASDDWWLCSQPLSKGTFPQATGIFPFNDYAVLAGALEARDVAAVIMEPMAFTWPEPGYLERVRELCTRTGTVLIFDEVISGFRFGLGGAQAHFGVTPDLATYGKGIANGFSVSALVGRRDLMTTPGVHLLSSTHGGETHGLAAAIATIDTFEREKVSARLWTIGERLMRGMLKLGYHARGAPQSPNVDFDSDRRWPPRDYSHGPSLRPGAAPLGAILGPERLAFQQHMADWGILAPYWAPSFSHTEWDVDLTLEVAANLRAS